MESDKNIDFKTIKKLEQQWIFTCLNIIVLVGLVN